MEASALSSRDYPRIYWVAQRIESLTSSKLESYPGNMRDSSLFPSLDRHRHSNFTICTQDFGIINREPSMQTMLHSLSLSTKLPPSALAFNLLTIEQLIFRRRRCVPVDDLLIQ